MRRPLVDLKRHQTRRAFEDLRGQSQHAQRVRGLQAEEATTDHDGRRARQRRLRNGTDRIKVVESSVDEAPVEIATRDRRDERIRTGGEHQRVVTDDGSRDVVTVRACRSTEVTDSPRRRSTMPSPE